MYVTDALQIMAENAAKMSGGKYMQRRYVEIIEPRKEETRSDKDVISHMKNVLKKLQ